MIKIQKKMKNICEYHPIVNLDIFDYFRFAKKKKDNNKDIKEHEGLVNEEDKTENIMNNANGFDYKKQNNSINQQSQEENKTSIESNIVTEIEL